MTKAGSRRRRRRVAQTVVTVVVVIAAGGVTAAATGLHLPGGKSGRTHSDLPPATAKVTRQTLLDTQVEDGSLGYGDTATLSGRLAGTVTGLPAVGSTVKRGQALYRVDAMPVTLLYGTLPAYRTLSAGLKGDDVKQFEQNLYALGYRGFTVDDTYSAFTATAVKSWQSDLGLPTTGVVELGRILYMGGPIRVDSWKAVLGDASAPGAEVYTYTGVTRVVSVELDVSDQRLAVKGAVVSAQLPIGKSVPGKIEAVKTVIKPAEGNNPASTKIDVTVVVNDQAALAGFDAATLRVGFTASRRENVLTVPVGALLALAEGGYGVQAVGGASTRIVAVQTGLFADGRVEVSGDGLTEGMTVGMSS